MTRNDRVHHRNLLWRMFGRNQGMLNDQMFLKCHQSGRNDFRCVFVAFMQLLQEVQNYLKVS